MKTFPVAIVSRTGSLCRRRQIGSEGVICVAWWWDGQGFTGGSLGTHPGLVGTKGTHPSIMILSWSDPVTYQPSPTTRAHHLPHPRGRTCKCNLHLGNLRPFANITSHGASTARIFTHPPTQVFRHIPRDERTEDCVTPHKNPLACPMSL